MLNPFDIIDKRLESLEQQNKQLLECLQRLEAKQSEDKLLSIAETCALFQPNISRQTLYSYERQGLLQRRMIGSRVCFSRNAVMDAVRSVKRYKKGGN